jgi:hypothetical protein
MIELLEEQISSNIFKIPEQTPYIYSKNELEDEEEEKND